MDALSDREIRGDGTSEVDWADCPMLARLPRLTVDALVPAGCRALVVAPHPDDEILGLGGLLVQLARAGRPVDFIAVTDGTASHPGSVEWTSQRLACERPRETREALARLGLIAEPVRLGLPDGELSARRADLAVRLGRIIQSDDIVFTTWRRDGHPDHEATGEACALAAARCGASLVEVPIWAWHWAAPGDQRLPWPSAWRLPLDAAAVARKRHAVQAFRSQLTHDASTLAGPVLRATTVARAARDFEVMIK